MDTYRIIEKEYIEEIDSEAMRMVHEKSGAKLLVLKNDNPNKYFGITFMTPPYDSSGIPHILEHSVLAGSRKYPSGSFEKLNQSLSVGLMNAETGNDHTNYYCYAKEEQDFDDCTDLILDSVFYPLVLEEENIFLREGWRIDFLDDGNGDIDIDVSGIVLNEMRACDSDYRRRIRERICKRLMPDSVYHHRAGGKSYKIPRCSYEELIKYHHKHYTASNAYVFIYGDVDLDSFLEKLDGYLKEKAGDEAVIIPKTDNVKELVRKKEKIHADQDEDHFYYYACLFDGKLKPNQALAFDLLKEEIEIIIESELSNIGIDGAAYSTFEQAGIQDRLEIKYVCDTEGAGKDIYKGIKRALTDRFGADNDFRAQLMGKINRYELRFWEEMQSKYSVGEYLYNMIQLYWFYSEEYVFDAFQVSDNIQYIKNRIWGNCFNTFITAELPKEGREILLECICDNRGEDYFSRRLYREIDNQVSGMEEEDIIALRKKSEDFRLWNVENDSC